jgi:hypothetical protein
MVHPIVLFWLRVIYRTLQDTVEQFYSNRDLAMMICSVRFILLDIAAELIDSHLASDA